MKQKTWFALVVVASLSATAATSFIPRRDTASEVQQCVATTKPRVAPRGHVACTLKSGKTIHLRSAK